MAANGPERSDAANSDAEAIAARHKRDFWIEENQKHIPPHYRLRKCARVISRIAGGRECDLLDVGCGPATLMTVLPGNVHYFGIDIAIHRPAPNLLEADILKTPIRFGEQKFDVVVAQGLFEYVGVHQSEKFDEIAGLLRENGRFVVTYTNFSHRARRTFEAFSNVQPPGDFRRDLARHFTVETCFPASHNWSGGQPSRAIIKAANMHLNANVPLISPRLAVDYLFICSARQRCQ